MKKRLLVALVALALLLSTGCTGLLEREYAVATYHSTAPEVTGSNDALRVESYQEMVNALLYLVTERSDMGTLRLYDYDQERAVEELTAACTEVSQEDPLGAYAVSYIKYDVSTIVSYLEADITITYRRTQEQVDGIDTVVGSVAIRNAFAQSLSNFEKEVVLKLSYYEGDATELQEILTRAYYSTPSAALGMPQVEIEFYPRTGTQRIAEVMLSYTQFNLNYRQSRMLGEAETIVEDCAALSGDALILELCSLLMGDGGLHETGDSAYDALIMGGATSEGLALALALLCEEAGIACTVVQGTLDGVEHFWNVVYTSEGYRQLDITTLDTTDSDEMFRSDRQADEMGYVWNQDWVPLCGDQPLDEQDETLDMVN